MRCALLSRFLLPLVAFGLLPAAAARAQVMAVDPSINVTPVTNVPAVGEGTVALPVTSPPSLYGIAGGGAVELGQDVVLTVQFNGTGTDQVYQWKKSGAIVSGATQVSYSIPGVTNADAGTYTVTVTNSAGSSVATTDVTVKPAASPAFVIQPRSLVVSVNQPAVFSFSATGSYRAPISGGATARTSPAPPRPRTPSPP